MIRVEPVPPLRHHTEEAVSRFMVNHRNNATENALGFESLPSRRRMIRRFASVALACSAGLVTRLAYATDRSRRIFDITKYGATERWEGLNMGLDSHFLLFPA